MVEASYFAHNYQLTTRYLDLNVHYVTVAHCAVMRNRRPRRPCSFAPVAKIKNKIGKKKSVSFNLETAASPFSRKSSKS